jgi:hypothetical protein
MNFFITAPRSTVHGNVDDVGGPRPHLRRGVFCDCEPGNIVACGLSNVERPRERIPLFCLNDLGDALWRGRRTLYRTCAALVHLVNREGLFLER